MRYTTIAILSLFCFTAGFAQNDSVKRVKYTPEFQFSPGLYLDFNQVRENNPIPSVRIISNDAPLDFNFYRNLVKNKKIGYFDEFGAQQEISTANIWGYCQDGKIYIQYNGEFNRVPIIGRVCHFIADVTVIDTHYDPYYSDYYNPYYYNPYYSRSYNRTTKTREMRQYLLDFETGKVLNFDRESVQVMLMQDPILYDEFMKVKKRQQNDLLFFFLRKLNEKYPVMIPVR
ncbi:MAG: hypothetical protein D4R64_07835 [Porphyromonadaceae bacterium]|nr:MAG: hypothetical protein D4R64_07835 [Porphyromonadaceae bacterium]